MIFQVLLMLGAILMAEEVPAVPAVPAASAVALAAERFNKKDWISKRNPIFFYINEVI